MPTIGVMRWQRRDCSLRDQAYLVDQLSLAASLTSRGALMFSNPRRLERFSRESYALSNLCALLERSNAVRGGEDSCEFARVQVGSRFNAELLEMNSVTTT